MDEDAALFIRGRYDPRVRLDTTTITMFRRDGAWSRTDVAIVQRSYDDAEIRDVLFGAGFARIESFAAADVGMSGDIAVGRRFYRCAR